MFEFAITRTANIGGTLSEATTLFAANPLRCYLSIRVQSGAMYVSIHSAPAEGQGIYVDADNPLDIQIPVTGSVRAVPVGTSVVYSAAEGLS